MPALRRTERGVLTGFLVALLLLGAIAIAARASIKRLVENDRWVDHTYTVIGHLGAVDRALVELGAGIRGYLLSGDRRFLHEYAAAADAARAQLDQLRSETGDNPRQQARLDSLATLVTHRLAVADSIVALRTRSGFSAAEHEWSKGVGVVLQERVASTVGAMIESERALLSERKRSVDASVAAAGAIMFGGSLLGFGVVAIAMFYLHRGFVTIRQHGVELQAANEQLDARVRARTAELEETQNRIARIAAVSPAVLHSFRLSPAGVASFPYAAPTFSRLYGVEPETVTTDASALLARIHPEDAPRIRASIAASAEALTDWRDEWRYEHPERGEIWLAGYSSPVREADGGTVWHGVLGDVTERREAEAARRQWALAFEHCAHGILMGRPSDNTILACNPSFARLLGRPAEELIGGPIVNLFPPEEREGVLAHAAECDRRGTVRFEGTMRGAGEARVEVQVDVVSVRGADEVPVYRIATIQDIAERKRATEELNRSNTDLEQFAYVASHDLQEPLRAVSGCVQLLQRKYQDKLDSRANELIHHSVDGATRMQKLIDDLLAFSRVGTREGHRAATDSARALDAALSNLVALVRESGAVVTHDPMPTLVVNEARLVSLFQNLVGNALKFRRNEEPRVHVGAARRGTEWQFSVRDNGLGIEPQYFEKVFGIFQRLHTRTEYPGTGMGLAMCKRIVEHQGGRIWLESQLGAGSTFHFTVPDAGLPV